MTTCTLKSDIGIAYFSGNCSIFFLVEVDGVSFRVLTAKVRKNPSIRYIPFLYLRKLRIRICTSVLILNISGSHQFQIFSILSKTFTYCSSLSISNCCTCVNFSSIFLHKLLGDFRELIASVRKPS